MTGERHPISPNGAAGGHLRRPGQLSELALVAGVLGVVLVILVPLPPVLIDPLLIVSITLSVVILMAAVLVRRPLEFSVFPSLILLVTFFRLALNIATTRLILGNAAQETDAAGGVVRTFGEFVGGANIVVGLVVFSVIMLVQFVVITRGATRVSEVAARFQLDSLPGKQLSVDGDLAAGLIDRQTAMDRRAQILREADFYGAMDGSSRFVRGDAIAGVVIVAINLCGGIAVGVFYHGMELVEAGHVFGRLTIGDGLVTQIPQLMVSVAAALLVTRNPASEDLANDLGRQVVSSDRALFVAGAFLLTLLWTGLPAVAVLLTAAACFVGGAVLRRERLRGESPARRATVPGDSKLAAGTRPASETGRGMSRGPPPVESLELVVGYRLLSWIDAEGGRDFRDRLQTLRARLAEELGIRVPPVRATDSRRLATTEYLVRLRGSPLGSWRAAPDGLLAVAATRDPPPVDGLSRLEIAGRAAVWIPADAAEAAVEKGYRLLEPARGLMAHLEELVRRHAPELLSRQEVSRLLEELRERAPQLVDDLVPHVLTVSALQKVLQALLAEDVSIRDLEAILEAVEERCRGGASTAEQVEAARRALRRAICAAAGPDGTVHAVVIGPELEDELVAAADGDGLRLDPVGESLMRNRLRDALGGIEDAGHRAVLLSPSSLRPHLARILREAAPRAMVLGYEEVLDVTTPTVHATVDAADTCRTGLPNEEVPVES